MEGEEKKAEEVQAAVKAANDAAELSALKVEMQKMREENERLRVEVAGVKAAAAIKQAEAEGKLTPAMLVEGSAYVELAAKDPDLFARLMAITPVRVCGNGQSVLTGYNAGKEMAGDERHDDVVLSADDKLIAMAEQIAKDRGVDFAEGLRLAHIEENI